jgi:VWFA-related protein
MKDSARTPNHSYGVGYCLSLLAVSVLAGGLALRSGAQTHPSPPQSQSTPAAQGPAISVDTKMVTMLAAVRDKHGKLVRDLTKDDFVVEQDGHPQSISYFAQDSNLPLTVGLLVDTSLSQRRVLDQEQSASGAFLDRMFAAQDSASATAPPAVAKPVPVSQSGASATPPRPAGAPSAAAAKPAPPRDQAFLVHFDYEVELLQDPTTSRQKLEAALKDLETPQFSNANSNGGNSGGGGHRGSGGGTLLYDAIYLASDEVIKTQQGRKALVVLTDGDDRGSKVSLETAIETAQRADAVVYSILFSDHDAQGNGGYGNPHMGGGHGGMGGGGMGGGHHGGYPQESRPDGKKVLERISRETGGRFFEVTKKQSIDDIYLAIDEELRNQYSIGYKPEPADAGPGYHKIHVTVKPKDLIVQTREGYYAGR